MSSLETLKNGLFFVLALGLSGCATGLVETGDLCAAAEYKLAQCGAAGIAGEFSGCSDAMAEQVLNADCSEMPQVLNQVEADAPAGFRLKGSRGHRRGGLACRLGFMTECPQEICEPDEEIEPPESDDPCIEWTRYDGCAACEYYRCRERESQCGEDAYLAGFVGKYCDRFSTVTEKRLSEAGSLWMQDVRHCLIEVLDAETDGNDSCETIERVGIDSHTECYLQAGFCDLGFTDWFAIVHTIDAFDIPFRQLLTTGHGCLRQWFGGRR